MSDSKQIKGNCKACKQPMVWLKSVKTGKVNVPVNPEGVEEGDVFFNFKKHTSHFATCIYASALRKNGKGMKGSVKNESVVGKPLVTVDEILRGREEVHADFRKILLNDKRPFILQNKLDITISRYAYLNQCAKLGLGFDELTTWESGQLMDWLAEQDPLAPEGALRLETSSSTLGKEETLSPQGSLF